ncbi:MAG TPA: nitroreductase family protein [Coriobacteriia bacterium]
MAIAPAPPFDAGRWFDSVPARRSRRAYSGAPGAGDLAALTATATAFTPFEDARVLVLPVAPPKLFSGIIGSYGRVTGECAALVFVTSGSSPAADVHCGYTGEALVLEAQARGLGTCWIAGSFSRSTAKRTVGLRAGERVRAVSPVGRPAEKLSGAERLLFGQGRPKHRKALEAIAPGIGSWPEWAAAGVRAAQVAPSAMNRQPWLFRYEDGSVVVGLDSAAPGMGRIDAGIAMLHFELGARAEGSDGVWEMLSGDGVARWVPIS